MAHRAVGFLFALLVASPASAQIIVVPAPAGDPAFSPSLPFDISAVTQGMEYDLRLVEADPERPGKEIMIFLPAMAVITVGRWHPEKHGVSGALEGPGLCVEPWASLSQQIGVWNYHVTGDATGDGIDDWIVYLQDGRSSLHVGRGLSACR